VTALLGWAVRVVRSRSRTPRAADLDLHTPQCDGKNNDVVVVVQRDGRESLDVGQGSEVPRGRGRQRTGMLVKRSIEESGQGELRRLGQANLNNGERKPKEGQAAYHTNAACRRPPHDRLPTSTERDAPYTPISRRWDAHAVSPGPRR
jgi:hypothetical protein